MAVTRMTGIAQAAPPTISTNAVRSSCRTPIARQSSAPVSTTRRRTSPTYTNAWMETDNSAANGPSSGTPERVERQRDQDEDRKTDTGIDAAKTRNGDGPTYGRSARARRSIPCEPAPAMSPIDNGDETDDDHETSRGTVTAQDADDDAARDRGGSPASRRRTGPGPSGPRW